MAGHGGLPRTLERTIVPISKVCSLAAGSFVAGADALVEDCFAALLLRVLRPLVDFALLVLLERFKDSGSSSNSDALMFMTSGDVSIVVAVPYDLLDNYYYPRMQKQTGNWRYCRFRFFLLHDFPFFSNSR